MARLTLARDPWRVVELGMTGNPKDSDEYTDEETVRRRDAALKRMLETPPKPHKEMKRKGGETVEQDEGPWDQSDPNCPSA